MLSRLLGRSWAFNVSALVLVIGSIEELTRRTQLKISESATTVACVVTSISFLLAYRTLRATHEWNRRQFTVTMSSRWNSALRPHLLFLEGRYPDVVQVPDYSNDEIDMSSWSMSDAEAKAVCMSRDPESAESVTRNHLIELFNEFENLSIAYEQHVVDRRAFEDSFVPVITDINCFFHPLLTKSYG